MNRFETCLAFILKFEGGFSDHPADKGGATAYGITQSVYDDFRVGGKKPVKEIEMAEVRTIYRQEYWIPSEAPIMPEPLDLVVFDCAVNHGVHRSAKLLQQTLGVDADGVIGMETMNAVHEEVKATSAKQLAEAMIARRREFYDEIVVNRPSQRVFSDGWNARCDALEKVLA
jgi:lysozyme family protein